MTTKDEALKLALDALHARISGSSRATEAEYKAAMACREALAQKDEHEPVAEITADDMGRPFNAIRIGAHFYKEIPPVGTKLYTAPPECQPLTDAGINEIADSMPGGLAGFMKGWGWQQFARAIEKAHGIGVDHDAQP